LSASRPLRVLDASAVLALLHEEPGADAVEAVLSDAAMSCVNLSEVLQKAEQHGIDTEGLEYDLEVLGVRLHDFDRRAARQVAELWPITRPIGLSLGDRACLALARALGGTAVTTDTRWAALATNELAIDVVR
jgi:ribonuclease VapC